MTQSAKGVTGKPLRSHERIYYSIVPVADWMQVFGKKVTGVRLCYNWGKEKKNINEFVFICMCGCVLFMCFGLFIIQGGPERMQQLWLLIS